jgi:CRP/FNR family cyclic AMP-dependent transcriptional regulator
MNVQQLAHAVESLKARDALPCKLGPEEWKALVPYLTPRVLRSGEPLVKEGDNQRELFILGDGELEVRCHGHVIATLKPGSVAGEGTFFSGEPRSATVSVSKAGVAFGLAWDRFDELSRKHPRLAIDLIKGLAAVLAIRMRHAVLVGQFT